MSVCLVGSDCERGRASANIADSLQQLITLSDNVFNQLMTRLDSCCDRLNLIGANVSRVEKKLDAVSKMNTAVVIYSPAKFPNNTYERLHSVFPFADPNGFGSTRPLLSPTFNTSHSCPPESHFLKSNMNDVILEKGKFFHVGVTLRDDAADGSAQSAEAFVANNVESLADLYVFNTLVNAFTDSQNVDPLECELRSHSTTRNEVTASKVSKASEEASALDVDIQREADPFHYEPELGILQDFNFPETLPDLPGIASDLTPSDSHFVPIAPSARLGSSEQLKSTNAKVTEPEKPPSVGHTGIPSITDENVIANNPETTDVNVTPSEREKSAGPLVSSDGVMDPTAASTSSTCPAPSNPPPPPPPPPSLLATSVSVNKNPEPSSSDVPTMDAGRSSLMEAIRRAGGTKGAKLRSVKKKLDESSDDVSVLPKHNILPPGDDLMTSLSKALEMRRRGISGKNRDRKIKSRGGSGVGEGVLAEISAMLPPPPKSEEGRSKDVDSDDDWEL